MFFYHHPSVIKLEKTNFCSFLLGHLHSSQFLQFYIFCILFNGWVPPGAVLLCMMQTSQNSKQNVLQRDKNQLDLQHHLLLKYIAHFPPSSSIHANYDWHKHNLTWGTYDNFTASIWSSTLSNLKATTNARLTSHQVSHLMFDGGILGVSIKIFVQQWQIKQ